jgi:hypothetical protein
MHTFASPPSRRSLRKLLPGRRRGSRVAVLGVVGAMLALTAVNVDASSGWSLVSSPNKGTFSGLSGVSCSNPSLCISVGAYGSSSSQKTLSEKWNGTTMAVVSSPPSSGNPEVEFNAVSCPSASFCMGVGRIFKSGTDKPLAEKWNGSKWTQLTTPSLGPGQADDLLGVSCKSPTWCMAVGWWTISPQNALAMLWNGTSWTVETVPNTNSIDDNVLNSISCVTTSFCIAVGTAGNGQLIDSWNGSTWTIVSSAANRALNGVRCRSTSFCVAVGAQGSSPVTTLVEQWNGATWSVISSANVTGSSANFLLSVSCTGTTFCMAGGYYLGSGSTEFTLTEAWNGVTWSVLPSIDPSSSTDIIKSVNCTTASGGNFCLAVGTEGSSLTLVEKYS